LLAKIKRVEVENKAKHKLAMLGGFCLGLAGCNKNSMGVKQ